MIEPSEVLQALRDHYNVLIYGPPGTGKTYLMQQVAQLFGGTDSESGVQEYLIDTESENHPIISQPVQHTRFRWVTFHQSYSYEEFIVGLRPDPQETGQLINLKPTPGVLLELAEFARQPGNSALLIIDEINRGNVSRIFGEFITLLETDYRLNAVSEATSRTVEINLPYVQSNNPVRVDIGSGDVIVPNPFTMPLRIYTLASMNSVDKSVAPLDTALRRRFQVINLMPDLGGMAKRMGIPQVAKPQELSLPETLTDVEHVKMLAIMLLHVLNHGIASYLGPEFRLGEWYLKDLTLQIESTDQAMQTLARIWEFKVLPQLEELFHGRVEQLETILGLDTDSASPDAPVYLERPDDRMGEHGAVPYLQRRDTDVNAVIRFLRQVSGVGVATDTPESPTADALGPEAQPSTGGDSDVV